MLVPQDFSNAEALILLPESLAKDPKVKEGIKKALTMIFSNPETSIIFDGDKVKVMLSQAVATPIKKVSSVEEVMDDFIEPEVKKEVHPLLALTQEEYKDLEQNDPGLLEELVQDFRAKNKPVKGAVRPPKPTKSTSSNSDEKLSGILAADGGSKLRNFLEQNKSKRDTE